MSQDKAKHQPSEREKFFGNNPLSATGTRKVQTKPVKTEKTPSPK